MMKKQFVILILTGSLIGCNGSDPAIRSADSAIQSTADSIKVSADSTIKKIDSTLSDAADSAKSKMKAIGDSAKKALRK